MTDLTLKDVPRLVAAFTLFFGGTIGIALLVSLMQQNFAVSLVVAFLIGKFVVLPIFIIWGAMYCLANL